MSKKQVVEVLVEGGKATPGPPLGPALGPLGVPIPKVIAAINEKTKEYAGMQVPVKVIVDPATKEFEIEVGIPPTSALIKKELGIEKGAKAGEIVGSLSLDQLVKIAKIVMKKSYAKDLKAAVKTVVGTCVSMGVAIEGKHPKEFLKEVDNIDWSKYET